MRVVRCVKWRLDQGNDNACHMTEYNRHNMLLISFHMLAMSSLTHLKPNHEGAQFSKYYKPASVQVMASLIQAYILYNI